MRMKGFIWLLIIFIVACSPGIVVDDNVSSIVNERTDDSNTSEEPIEIEDNKPPVKHIQAKECTYEGETYVNSQQWPANDGCNTCSCINGDVWCSEIECGTSCESSQDCEDEAVCSEGECVMPEHACGNGICESWEEEWCQPCNEEELPPGQKCTGMACNPSSCPQDCS